MVGEEGEDLNVDGRHSAAEVTKVTDRSGNPRPSWLTIQDIADLLRVSRDTVERWIHTGQLRAVDVSSDKARSGRRTSWRISTNSLERFLEARANRPYHPRRETRRRKAMPGTIEIVK